MKWKNIPKGQRRSEWHVVGAPSIENLDKAAAWCRANSSDGYFYNHYTNTRWWFSKEEDALLFALKWSESESSKKKQIITVKPIIWKV